MREKITAVKLVSLVDQQAELSPLPVLIPLGPSCWEDIVHIQHGSSADGCFPIDTCNHVSVQPN